MTGNGAREPYILATENDVLNGLGMLFMKLLTNRAQIFADVRTYWSPDAVKKATGYDLEGVAKEAGGFIHLINSGAACLDANGEAKDENGNAVMKQWWDVTEEDQKAIMDATTWNAWPTTDTSVEADISIQILKQKLRCLQQ